MCRILWIPHHLVYAIQYHRKSSWFLLLLTHSKEPKFPTFSPIILFCQSPLHSRLYTGHTMSVADMTLMHQAISNMFLFDLVSSSPSRKIRFGSVRRRQWAPAKFQTYGHDTLIQESLKSKTHFQTDSINIPTNTTTKYTSNSSWTSLPRKWKQYITSKGRYLFTSRHGITF